MSLGHSGFAASSYGVQPMLVALRRHFAARPLRPHFLVWTGIGMAVGIAMTPWSMRVELDTSVPAVFIMTGALLGGTAFVWLAPTHWLVTTVFGSLRFRGRGA